MAVILAGVNDAHLNQTLQKFLSKEHHIVFTEVHDRAIFSAVREARPDLVILEAQPEIRKICTHIRRLSSQEDTLILVVAKDVDAHLVAELLDAGADDVLKSPVAITEMLARVRVLLRWHSRDTEDKINIRFDPSGKWVYIDQRRIRLTPIEYQLLEFLCRNRTQYYTAVDLLQKLWNYPPEAGDTALVRNHIRNLRSKLEHDPDRPQVLISQYGRGYTVQARVLEN